MSNQFKFESKSSDRVHTVTVHDGGVVTCTCFGFRQAKDGKCWHVKKVIADEGITSEEDPSPEQEELFEQPTGFIAPMLASRNKGGWSMDDFTTEEWVGEEKYDGHRMIIKVVHGDIEVGPQLENVEVVAWSRNQIIRQLPFHIKTQLYLFAAGVYDSELVIPGGTSTDVASIHLQHTAQLYIFDMLEVNGTSCTHLSYTNRRKLLEAATVISPLSKDICIWLPVQLEPTNQSLQVIWNRGGEGMIVKKRSSGYEVGIRSKVWIKFKRVEHAELTITGFNKGSLGPHSKILAEDDEGIEVSVKAKNDEWRIVFAQDAEHFIGKTLVIAYQGRSKSRKYTGPPRADHILGEDL